MKWTSLGRVDIRPAGASVLSPAEAGALIEALARAESLVWYCGYLPIDRLHPRSPQDGMSREEWQARYQRERAVERLAQYMLRQGAPAHFTVAAHKRGYAVDGLDRGSLSQRRLDPLFYEYIFTRTA